MLSGATKLPRDKCRKQKREPHEGKPNTIHGPLGPKVVVPQIAVERVGLGMDEGRIPRNEEWWGVVPAMIEPLWCEEQPSDGNG